MEIVVWIIVIIAVCIAAIIEHLIINKRKK